MIRGGRAGPQAPPLDPPLQRMSNPWLVLIETKLRLSLYTKLERRNPCSKSPTVYADLSTRNDWTVKITIVNLTMEIRNAFSIIR